MSLRTRLTILYTVLLAGILLLFAVVVSLSFNLRVNQALDSQLARAAELVLSNIKVSPNGAVVVNAAGLQETLPAEVLVQVYDRSSQPIYGNTRLMRILDAEGLSSSRPRIRSITNDTQTLRVLTVPFQTSNRPLGVFQVSVSADLASDVQGMLLQLTMFGVALGTLVAAVAVWLSTRQALHSLESATQVATQITKADDLSRRIPYEGSERDEIGQLIGAFNQTLSRLEGLFNSQRRFLADVGHELRTPLTVIKGNTSLMRRMSCGDEESLESIESEVDRLTRMVGDLLLLAQAESGKLPLNRKLVEMDTLLLEAMSQMSVLAHEKLQLRLAEIDQVLVCGDRDRLKQVIVNLISNAINYTPAGEVVLSLSKVEGKARLTVSDAGPGIPAEDLPHIFERFYRGEKARTRGKSKGFGLGLSIVYWIVRNHDGRIDVDSTLGKGTIFCVWLPLAPSENPAECENETSANAQAKQTAGAARDLEGKK